MKKAPSPTKAKGAFQNHETNRNSIATPRFAGTKNPRILRMISALMAAEIPREQLDRIAGASNSPALVLTLRRLGLAVPCDRVNGLDRDGRACRPGVYSLSPADRRKVRQWMNRHGERPE